MDEAALLLPDWQAPAGVFAAVTTRHGGFSQAPYDGFNLGLHVGDDPAQVERNRARLQALLKQQTGLAQVPVQWLQQVHGCAVHSLTAPQPQASPPVADALYTRQPAVACAVLTADCLPVLFASADGAEIAVAHAGWRGLANGVLEATLQNFAAAPAHIHSWLGPAIGSCHFEVGIEVREQFVAMAARADREATAACFIPGATGKFLCDLYALARLRLQAAGLQHIAGQQRCTVCDSSNWYSYRRAHATGRFATLILRGL